jgi:hypothetical protein
VCMVSKPKPAPATATPAPAPAATAPPAAPMQRPAAAQPAPSPVRISSLLSVLYSRESYEIKYCVKISCDILLFVRRAVNTWIVMSGGLV